jgi:mannose-1-phosphate guanylyltransferase
MQSYPNSLILEPFGCNTVAGIAAAALRIVEARGEEAVMVVLATDHLIADQQAVLKAVELAWSCSSPIWQQSTMF